MLVIEVTPEDVKTEPRIIPSKDNAPSRTLYDQTVLFRMGGRSIVEAVISHNDAQDCLEAGLYTLDGSSYQLDRYARPELKKGYQQKIIPLADAIAPYLHELKK